ncbi:MAG TPA: hypothetical protein VGE02_17745 [Gemmatimonadales bacterium]
MSVLSRVAGAAVAAAAVLGLTVASHVPVSVYPSDDSMLRVAFSARPERVERCRTMSDEELAEIPAHMRQRVVCEGFTARYRLQVLREGRVLATADVRGGGLRHDRQLYVLRELPVPSGRAAFEIRLTRVDSALTGGTEREDGGGPASAPAGGVALAPATERERREVDERSRRVADEVPPELVWRETVTLEPREVLLVTYDRADRRLRAVRGGG